MLKAFTLRRIDEGGFGGSRRRYNQFAKLTFNIQFSKLALTSFDGAMSIVPARRKRAKHLVDLGWAPFAFTQDSPDSIGAYQRRLVRVHTSGRLETVYRRVYGILYPDSLAISPNGVIHAGMRHRSERFNVGSTDFPASSF